MRRHATAPAGASPPLLLLAAAATLCLLALTATAQQETTNPIGGFESLRVVRPSAALRGGLSKLWGRGILALPDLNGNGWPELLVSAAGFEVQAANQIDLIMLDETNYTISNSISTYGSFPSPNAPLQMKIWESLNSSAVRIVFSMGGYKLAENTTAMIPRQLQWYDIAYDSGSLSLQYQQVAHIDTLAMPYNTTVGLRCALPLDLINHDGKMDSLYIAALQPKQDTKQQDWLLYNLTYDGTTYNPSSLLNVTDWSQLLLGDSSNLGGCWALGDYNEDNVTDVGLVSESSGFFRIMQISPQGSLVGMSEKLYISQNALVDPALQRYGFSLLDIGDVNNDTIPDILAGCPGTPSTNRNGGGMTVTLMSRSLTALGGTGAGANISAMFFASAFTNADNLTAATPDAAWNVTINSQLGFSISAWPVDRTAIANTSLAANVTFVISAQPPSTVQADDLQRVYLARFVAANPVPKPPGGGGGGGGGNSNSALVGGVVGGVAGGLLLLCCCLLLVIVVVALVVLLCCRRRHQKELADVATRSSVGGSMRTLTVDAMLDQSQLKFIELIGRGAGGEVWRGEWHGTQVAIKRIFAQEQDDALAEAELLKELRHPNVVQFLGTTYSGSELLLVTELMAKGGLDSILRRDGALSEARAVAYALDAAQGLLYLHTRQPKIIHRDIKPGNLLVDAHDHVKIGDFGISRQELTRETMTTCGTPHYMAPEIMRCERYNERADVYSFGVVLWEMIAGRVPFEGMQAAQVLLKVINGDRPPLPAGVSDNYAQLVTDCWNGEPDQRPSTEELVRRLQSMRS